MMVSVNAINTIAGLRERDGGPSRAVSNLCSSVARAGVNVSLIVGHDRVRDGKLILPSTNLCANHLVSAEARVSVSFYNNFWKAVHSVAAKSVASNNPIIIHDNGMWGLSNIATSRCARSMNIPCIISAHGALDPWSLQYKASKKKLAWALYQKEILQTCTAFVANSEQECDNIKQRFPHHPVAVIPNGVDVPNRFSTQVQKTSSSRHNLLYMSRIHPIKNLFGLVQAWQEVCKIPTYDHWVLQIAGPDELNHTREVMGLVSSFGLNSRVEFLGPIAECAKAQLFDQADLFVLPSFSENFGIVVAEALSYGIPVVATKGTPWRALVDHDCGWWVESDSLCLSQGLCEAMSKSYLERLNMGLRGRNLTFSTFSWDGIGSMTVQLYDWLLKRSSNIPSFVHM